jgi:hypothetical protein
MPQLLDPVTFVEDVVSTLNVEGMEALIAKLEPLCVPDVAYRLILTGDEVNRGREEMFTAFRDLERDLGRPFVTDATVSRHGARVLVLATLKGQGSTSGLSVGQPMGWIFGFDDEHRVCEFLSFTDQEEARRAAA